MTDTTETKEKGDNKNGHDGQKPTIKKFIEVEKTVKNDNNNKHRH